MFSVTDDIIYVGVNDRNIDLFEGQYEVENGMAYNSYLILDDKITVMDSVDAGFTDEWIGNIRSAAGDKDIDYIVVSHMEPDHSGSLAAFMNEFPNVKIISSQSAFNMMKQFFGTDFSDRNIVIKEGDTITTGKHTLKFLAAPMVHWPEVIMTFDCTDRVIFSADAFGKFGSLDTDEDWACEARRYYFGIVDKFGIQVQAVLKKLSALDIQKICPLHGPVITENLDYYINLYNTWSSYGVKSEGICIAYTSVYGNTKKAALLLKSALEEQGCPKVAITDLARDDMAEAVEDAFRYGKLVLATTTYNNDIFPKMKEFITHLTDKNYQNRTVAFIENGTWAPAAAKNMAKLFESSKNINYAQNSVTIKSALTEENIASINALAAELK